MSPVEEGKHDHEKIIHYGFASDMFMGSSLVDMYAKMQHGGRL
jgi:hypothetical protein